MYHKYRNHSHSFNHHFKVESQSNGVSRPRITLYFVSKRLEGWTLRCLRWSHLAAVACAFVFISESYNIMTVHFIQCTRIIANRQHRVHRTFESTKSYRGRYHREPFPINGLHRFPIGSPVAANAMPDICRMRRCAQSRGGAHHDV